MTILALLIGLLISHYATGVRHCRQFNILLAPSQWVHARNPEPSWAVMAVLIVTCVLAAVVAKWLMTGLAGTLGWFLLAVFVFIYCLGPRDLDKDVQELVDNGLTPQAAETMEAMQLSPESTADEAAAAVYHASLSRW
ncbi:MAG: hypothetical protein AAGJ52_06770, partial [Pseudomonadota bacterium]